MEREQRTASRIGFGLRIILPQRGETYFTRDISLQGCFLAACMSARIGEEMDLALDLPAFGYVRITGQVRHVTGSGTGLMFSVFKDRSGKKAFEEFLYVLSLCQQLS